MYERRNDRPLTSKQFRWRMLRHVGTAIAFLAGSVLLGAVGFVLTEDSSWDTALMHAMTLVSGLGLAELPQSTSARLFAGLFALYSGVVFVAVAGIIMAPIAHRILHLFHWEEPPSPPGS